MQSVTSLYMAILMLTAVVKAPPPPLPPVKSSNMESPSDAAAAAATAVCPPRCECVWRRGKETLDCEDAGYEGLPVMAKDSGTQVRAITLFFLFLRK